MICNPFSTKIQISRFAIYKWQCHFQEKIIQKVHDCTNLIYCHQINPSKFPNHQSNGRQHSLPADSTLYLSVLFLLSQENKRKKALYTLPPGPKPYPLVGNLLQLGPTSQLHITFTSLSKTYGPIFSLQLGQVTTIILSSRENAKKIFQNHDLTFACRQESNAARAQAHHEWFIPWLLPGPRWRSLHRLCTTGLFTTQRLDSHLLPRRQKVQELLDFVSKSAQEVLESEYLESTKDLSFFVRILMLDFNLILTYL